MSLLEVSGLTKSYQGRRGLLQRRGVAVQAVKDVSFTVEAGETLALVGESGAGKSTIGRLVLRLIPADRGAVYLDGVDVLALNRKELRQARRQMQMIFQDPFGSLDPRVPIGESISEPLLVHLGATRRERAHRAYELLEQVGLSTQDFTRYPGELSGGQLQRVAIARALTLDPKLIVCDEPVSALDVSVRAQVLGLMRDLQEALGLTYLFISHDLALVKVIADRVAVMTDGEIVEQGTIEDVYQRPASPYTRTLLSAIPVPIPRALRRTKEVDGPADDPESRSG